VDELLGVNQAENERRVQQITTAYDNSEGNSKREHLPTLTAAVADYPLDYRLWVRYLECLLRNTMGIDGALAAHKQAREIYENIAAHCTDDSIRMWAKRLMVMHLHSLAQAEPARQAECEALLGEMPTLRCTREHVAVMVMTGEQQQQARQHLIAELEWLLAHAQYHEAGKAQNKA
ncbi:MAG: hypothetical protein FWB76_02250, partial [Oscillospiraceae bacterium]|nr:hypothetical protein [Oscillospiraceae bacterium]